MGVSVDSGGGGVDVDINLVPFIDLMSCLVAFLLVTAVWTNVAQMKVTPKGVGRDAEQTLPTTPPVNISVLVAADSVWIGLTTGDRRQIKNEGENYNYVGLEEVLAEYKNNSGIFKDRRDIEIAAEDGVKYQAVINTMDSAIGKGFPDIGFVDPNSLSVRFKQ
jgi:biopolymer transport protein ExbD